LTVRRRKPASILYLYAALKRLFHGAAGFPARLEVVPLPVLPRSAIEGVDAMAKATSEATPALRASVVPTFRKSGERWGTLV